MFDSRPVSFDPYRMNIASGVAAFCLFSVMVSFGSPTALLSVSVIAWLLLFPVLYWVTQIEEGRTVRDISNPLEQSWSLYGYTLLLLPAYLVAVVDGWFGRPELLPSWAWHWWWAPAGAVTGFIIGWVFDRLDKGRYDPLSLDEPAKRYHNDVLVTVLAALMVTRVVPVLCAPWNTQTSMIVGLMIGWVALVLVDGLRYFAALPSWAPTWAKRLFQRCRLIPEKQHPHYDKFEGRLLYRGS